MNAKTNGTGSHAVTPYMGAMALLAAANAVNPDDPAFKAPLPTCGAEPLLLLSEHAKRLIVLAYQQERDLKMTAVILKYEGREDERAKLEQSLKALTANIMFVKEMFHQEFRVQAAAENKELPDGVIIVQGFGLVDRNDVLPFGNLSKKLDELRTKMERGEDPDTADIMKDLGSVFGLKIRGFGDEDPNDEDDEAMFGRHGFDRPDRSAPRRATA